MMQIGKFLSSSLGSGWLTLFSAPEVSPEIKALAVDADDNVYLAGERSSSTDGWYAKLNANAEKMFLARCSMAFETVALGSDGKCYMGYLAYITQLVSDGSRAFVKRLTDSGFVQWGLCRRLYPSASGRILAQSAISNGSSYFHVVSSLNFDGSVIWLKRITGASTSGVSYDGLVELSDGSIVVASQVPNSSYSACQLTKLSSTGTYISSKVLAKNTSTTAQCMGMVSDSENNIYVLLLIYGTELCLLKFNETLSLQWNYKVGAATLTLNYGNALHLGGDGNLYFFAYEGSSSLIVKVTLAGELVFCRQIAPSSAVDFSTLSTRGSFIYVAGRRYRNGYYAPFILKLPNDGSGIGTHALPNDFSVTYSAASKSLSSATHTITAQTFESESRSANVINQSINDSTPDFTQATVMI